MSQRLYMDYEWPCYDSEPPVTSREKASKMAEIQTYVNVLIENNRAYGEELNILKRENTDLRGQTELLMGQNLRMKERNEDLLSQTKAQYAKEVGRLIDQLKDILNKKEQMEGSYKSLLEELSYQSESDKKSRGLQLLELERNFENKIKILNDRIAEQNRQIESNFYMQSDSKLRMVKEIDELNYEVCELRKENNDLRQAHRFDEEEILRLSASIKLLNKEKEDLGVDLLKIEQEKNNQLIDLKQAMGQLRQQLNDQMGNLKKFEVSVLTKDKELQQMIDKHDLSRREKDNCQQYSIKLSAELNDKSKQLANLKNEHTRLSDFSAKELKRMSELIRVLETDNNKLGKEKQELEDQGKVKQEEIYTLLDRVQCLQSELGDLHARWIKQEQTNISMNKEVLELKEEVDSLILDLKNEQEKCELQTKHILTLQQVVEKEKKKNYYLQGNNFQKEMVVRQMPDELTKKYEQQIKEIYRRNDDEKSQLMQKFQYQKEHLIRMYQMALKEKEILFKDKLMTLESEIRELGLA